MVAASFPVAAIPPLIFQICDSIGNGPMKIDHHYEARSLENIELTEEVAQWIQKLCYRLFPCFGSFADQTSLSASVDSLASGYNLSSSSYVTIVKAFLSLQPKLQEESDDGMISVSTVGVGQTPAEADAESFWEECWSLQSIPDHSKNGNINCPLLNLSSYQPSLEMNELASRESKDTPQEVIINPVQSSSRGGRDVSVSFLEDLRSTALRIILLATDLILYRIDEAQIHRIPPLAQRIRQRISEYSFKGDYTTLSVPLQ